MVQARLNADGYDACVAVLHAYAREAKANGGRWFNGTANWGAKGFGFALGSIGAIEPGEVPTRESFGGYTGEVDVDWRPVQ